MLDAPQSTEIDVGATLVGVGETGGSTLSTLGVVIEQVKLVYHSLRRVEL